MTDPEHADDRDEARLIELYRAPEPRPAFADELDRSLCRRLAAHRPASPTRPSVSRRRLVTAAAAVAALVTLAVLAGLRTRHEASPENLSPGLRVATPMSTQEAAALEVRMAELDREAATRLRVVRLLDRHEQRRQRLRECQAVLLRPDPLVAVDREVNRSAEILVKQADALLRDHGLKDPAAETFRRVAQLFPETGWAEVARRRLADIY